MTLLALVGLSLAQEAETWIGTLAVVGTRSIPLLGTVEYRTDTHVLAEAIRTADDRWTVTQYVCDLTFKKALGATVTLAPNATRAVPATRFDWVRGTDGNWSSVWLGGWNEADHDGDGRPGIRFAVAAPLCGGALHIASAARNEAHAEGEGPLRGRLRVWTEQRILQSEGACLRVMARDRKEWLPGRYAFVAAAGATCDVPAAPWPDPFAP
jgi:hypothetical protein